MSTPTSEQILRDIETARGLLAAVYDPASADIWLRSRHKLLNGDTPLQRIARGDIVSVVEVIEQLVTGAYI